MAGHPGPTATHENYMNTGVVAGVAGQGGNPLLARRGGYEVFEQGARTREKEETPAGTKAPQRRIG